MNLTDNPLQIHDWLERKPSQADFKNYKKETNFLDLAEIEVDFSELKM